jgi:hypothetical protein
VSHTAASAPAHAELIARHECNIVGTLGQKPIGDRPGHRLVSSRRGTGSVAMQNGTATRSQATDNVVFKLASGSLASLAGETVVDFTARPTGPEHFIYEMND